LGPCSPEGDELLETAPAGAGGASGFGSEGMATGRETEPTASWKSWRSWRKFLLQLCLKKPTAGYDIQMGYI